MNLPSLFAVSLAALLAVPGGAAAPAVAADTRAFDRLLAERYLPGRAGAAVLVKRGPEVLFHRAYGMASLELGVPMTPDRVFRIGSVTKSFGAVIILQLVDEGKLDLDVPISTYLKEVPSAWAKVTLAHLLSHTSGIASYTAGPQGGYAALRARRRSLEEVVATLRGLPLEFEPGSSFTYSNSGYLLLQQVIERITGLGFAANLQTRIAGPQGLRHTRQCDPDLTTPGLVTGYTDGGRPTYPAPLDVAFMDGGMVSTLEDLAAFTEALHGGRLLRPETYRRMVTEVRTPKGEGVGYGLGLWIRSSQGHRLVGHGGDVVGFSAEVEADLDARTVAVILQNEDKFGTRHAVNVEYLSRRLLAQAAGHPIAEPRPVVVPEQELARLVGTYVSSQGRRTISLEQGRLWSRNNGGRPYELKATSPSTFYIEGHELRLRFTLEGGRALAVQAYEDQGDQGPLARRQAE